MISLKELREQLQTQDNLATSCPIYMVQVRNRILGMDSSCTDDYVWMDIEAHELVLETDKETYDWLASTWGEGYTIDDFEEVYYIDLWMNVQPFLTMKAAEAYIEANAHNLDHPRVYVESGYRNHEWEFLRDYFLNLED